MAKNIFLAFLVLATSLAAHAGPEQDYKALRAYYKKQLPQVKHQNYVYGALALNSDAMDQYNSIMMFPPFVNDVDEGRVTWEKPFKNGKNFASCFPNGGRHVAGAYPYFDDASGKVVTFVNALNACLKANGEPELKYSDRAMVLLESYAKSLSDGSLVNVKVKGPAALAAYEKGKEFYYARRGQLNFSCATCHIDNAGKLIRSEQLSPLVGQGVHWPVFRGGTEPTSLHARFRGCNKQVRAVPLEFNSEEYNNLEYFLTYMSNGLPMQAPVFRK